METTVVYWGYVGIMEKNMETASKASRVLAKATLGTARVL